MKGWQTVHGDLDVFAHWHIMDDEVLSELPVLRTGRGSETSVELTTV